MQMRGVPSRPPRTGAELPACTPGWLRSVQGPTISPRDVQGGSQNQAALTSSSRLGTRKDRRSHSSADSQKVATRTPLTNWTCLAWTALSLTARMENVLARNAMANSKLRAMSNPFRPLQGVGGTRQNRD